MTAVRGIIRVAVLHQAVAPPLINGVSKPPKPGGYQDSSADIAFALSGHLPSPPSSSSSSSSSPSIIVLTPVPSPSPTIDSQWSFPDTIQGILSAVSPPHNATHLFCNTTLFASHPLALLSSQGKLPKGIKFVGQDPRDTERFEDKAECNEWLRGREELEGWFPKSWLILKKGEQQKEGVEEVVKKNLPVVIKPVRGRGSHGVSLVRTEEELEKGLKGLWEEGELILVEEYMRGEEITVTVMPPGDYGSLGKKPRHFALPIVTRFNHVNGVAPYNGVAAVTTNSRVITPEEAFKDSSYADVSAACERVAEACNAWAPIRIDARRRREKGSSREVEGKEWGLFDINMKPNATGPGRPGRDDQDSLTMMAARGLGWSYGELLENILRQSHDVPVYALEKDGA